MNTSKFRAATLFSMSVVIISALFCGCGTNPQQGGGDGSTAISPANAPGTLLATVEDPQFGTYELVAQDEDQQSGKWNFLVRATRGGAKGQLRFVWDFGNGPEAEGIQQTYNFTSNGTYVIKVSALQADNSVAFVLKLTIEVVVDPNQAPVAMAGGDQAVYENDLVFLFGGNSSDPDNDAITFAWTQTFGPTVQILHAAEASASFVAPLVDADTDLVFRLTVSDGVLSSQDDAIVHVKKLLDPAGIGLLVDAGPDQQVAPGVTVTLSGSATPADPEIVYAWKQFQGPSVTITNANLTTASFVAPAVAAGTTIVLGFELVATLMDAVEVDEANVTVIADAPPVGGGTDPCTVDTDRDGANDCVDQCPNDPRKGAPGICGCGVADTDADGDATPDCLDECPNDPEKVAAGLCGCGAPETPNCLGGTNCVTSQTTWRNTSFAAQTGRFEVNFDATPSLSAMDGIVALSRGSATTFGGFAVIVRFNPAGTIDARNGGSYAAATSIAYTGGERVHFRLVVDVPAKRYDVFVTRAGSAEAALGLNYAFRTEQNTVASLDNWGAWADVGTSLEVCGFAISSPALAANAGTDVTIAPGGSASLSGSASGGTPPYTYRWSPSTGLSNVNIANPTATPAATTVYSLTVTDSLNATANDSVTVTVQAASALVANAGPDQTIAPGGSVVLSGSATGGTAPYTYRWSPTTGLSNANVVSPTALPSATTTYTLTVTDNQSRTASDSTVVTVTTVTTGNTYYVDKNHAAASDNNAGTSELLPWKTLAKAGNTARAGDTVYVKAGTYTETLRPVNSGTAGNLITFKAYPGDACQGPFAGTKIAGSCKVIIDGQNIRPHGVDLSRPVKYVRIEGFEMVNQTENGVYVQGWGDTGTDAIEIVNNFIHDCGLDAIYGKNSRNSLYENNEVYNSGDTAIEIGGQYGSQNIVIRGNNLHYIGKDGVRGGCVNCVIEQNRMYDSFHTDKHQDALDLAYTQVNVVIRYNVLYDFTQLIYFPLKDEPGNHIENVEIYGNVLYTDRYWTVNGGEAPGIFIDARCSDCPVRNVTIHSNTVGWVGYGAVWIYGNSGITDITIRNNIFYESGVDVGGTLTNLTSDYNSFFNRAKPSFEGPNSLVADPMFTDYRRHQSWDFHLRQGSPAIDRGDPNLGSIMTLPTPFVDIDNNRRPNGTRYDIGAYERQ